MSTSRLPITVAIAIVLGSAATPSFADLSQPDRGFATQAAQDNKSEIQDAQVAETSYAPNPVKLLAQKIVKDRSNASADLKTVAQQENFSLPDHPRNEQQQERTKLKNLAGNSPSHPREEQQRDRAYVPYETERLKTEISRLNNEVMTGTNRPLKEYAQKYLPVIQDELKMAQSVNTSK